MREHLAKAFDMSGKSAARLHHRGTTLAKLTSLPRECALAYPVKFVQDRMMPQVKYLRQHPRAPQKIDSSCGRSETRTNWASLRRIIWAQ
jgi:hypothetical protein